jgi:hypothetical protein
MAQLGTPAQAGVFTDTEQALGAFWGEKMAWQDNVNTWLTLNPNAQAADMNAAAQANGGGYDPSTGVFSFSGQNYNPTEAARNKAYIAGLPGGVSSMFPNAATQPEPLTGGGGFSPTAKMSNPFKYDQKNPYLADMSKAITGDITSNLTRNIMPQISSGAQQVGGFGGSRQGVVEANALNDANKQAANALTGMYYGDYNNAMGRQLQKYGMDQGYNLGMGNLQLGNRNTDLNQMQVGANLFQQGNTGFLNQGQGNYNLGLTAQQAPWQAYNNFNQGAQPYTGTGSTTQTQNGSAGAGFLGGALGASQMYNIFK